MPDASPPRASANEIDGAALEAWLDENEVGCGPVTGIEALTGGTQNLLVAFLRGGHPLVLRAARGAGDGRTIRREVRVLRAIEGSVIPHPRVFGSSDGEPTIACGAAFLVMERIDGYNPTIELAASLQVDPAARHRLGLDVAAAIAAVAAIDQGAVGLDDLGRPDGFLERQVERWLGQLAGYADVVGYDGMTPDDVGSIAIWLERNLPTATAPGLIHGDFHLSNVLVERHGPAVAAIIDWELATVGDPLLDLGTLLATWPDETGRSILAGPLIRAGGLPSAAELVATYAQHSDRPLVQVDWYVVLACLRLASVLEGTVARAAAGGAKRTTADHLHRAALALIDRAHATIGGNP
jgi:aminoglycoside phosphotransferase (APT) family kinase protein